MPNPFPGMNPYLENPTLWRGVHSALLTYVRDALQTQLPPDYVARLEESVEIEESDHRWKQDVSIAAENGSHTASVTVGRVATIARPVILELEEELPARWIEIFDVRSREVITVIELLSPTNKTGAGEGQLHYLSKLRHLFLSDTNIVEIDLLRGGLPTAAADVEPDATIPPHDYLVSVSRGHDRCRYEVYPLGLGEPLPNIAIPLRHGDADVILELQPLINRVYDNGAFDRIINYQQAPPLPPLNETDAAWLDELLREKKLRSAPDAAGK